jgi:hypothetical protein
MLVGTPKVADHSGYQQIIRPSRGMRAGLKILVSLQRFAPGNYPETRLVGSVSTYIVVFWAAMRRSSSLTML